MKTLILGGSFVIIVVLLLAAAAGSLKGDGGGSLLNEALTNIEGYPQVDAITPPREGETPLTAEELIDLPFTKHALEAHPDRKLNAVKIHSLMITLQCRPVEVFVCTDVMIVTCPFFGDKGNDKVRLGMIVGIDSPGIPNIVSGYPMEWKKVVSRCQGPYTVIP